MFKILISIAVGVQAISVSAQSSRPDNLDLTCISQKDTEGKSTFKVRTWTDGCNAGQKDYGDLVVERSCARIIQQNQSTDASSGFAFSTLGYCETYFKSGENVDDNVICHGALQGLSIAIIIDSNDYFLSSTMFASGAAERDDSKVYTDYGVCA